MRFRKRITRALPLVVSIGLLAAIIWWVSPVAVARAAVQLNWQLLVPATAAMVVALYFWDALCLGAVYGVDGQELRYRRLLHVRGLSYLVGALNYQLGQGAMAWWLARLQNSNILRMLSRSVVLAYHDAFLLLALGLAGSLLTNDARVLRLRPFIAIAFAVVVAVGLLFWKFPKGLGRWLRPANAQLILADWSMRRSLRLLPLRVGYFGILVIYASAAFVICGIPIDVQVLVSTIPLVLLADGLPNIAGLGTRETSLVLLLDPDEPHVLVAMSLIWSVGMIVFRFLIGLTHLRGHHLGKRAIVEDVIAHQNPRVPE